MLSTLDAKMPCVSVWRGSSESCLNDSIYLLLLTQPVCGTRKTWSVKQVCIIMHSVIVEERRSEYTTDGAGGNWNYNALTQEIDDLGEHAEAEFAPRPLKVGIS